MKDGKALKLVSSSKHTKTQPATSKERRVHANFLLLLAMDLVARTGYQMGKSPVLPLFASALGASTEMSGMIVAVSTTTGLITSPMIGTLSDMYGRRRLLLAGTVIFALTPFAYLYIQTSTQLLVLRVIHGFGTAIYGPVLAASVADMFQQRRAGRMAWYGAVRTASYLLGPLLGGFVLVFADFRTAWIIVGVTGALAFVPALALPRASQGADKPDRLRATWRTFHTHLLQAFRNPKLLTLGLIEAAMYSGLRANKAFLPLYAVSVGLNAAQVGVVFSIQVGSSLVAQPACGRLADRVGRKPLIIAGLLVIASALPLFVMSDQLAVLVALGILLGLGEAAILPPVMALGTELSAKDRYGSTLGMLDAMDNVGKALGPILVGLLLAVFSYVAVFSIIAAILVILALALAILVRDEV